MSRKTTLNASLSLAELIVASLKRYGTVSIDFLARILGQRTSDIEEYVNILERETIVVRENNKVALISHPLEKQAK